MVMTAFIVSAGIKDGIGRMVKILMPMLGFFDDIYGYLFHD